MKDPLDLSTPKPRTDLKKWGEPPPKEGREIVYTEVMKDIESRAEFGLKKYGTYLKTNNGRNALKDAYEEILDLAMYLKQLLEEKKMLRFDVPLVEGFHEELDGLIESIGDKMFIEHSGGDEEKNVCIMVKYKNIDRAIGKLKGEHKANKKEENGKH